MVSILLENDSNLTIKLRIYIIIYIISCNYIHNKNPCQSAFFQMLFGSIELKNSTGVRHER